MCMVQLFHKWQIKFFFAMYVLILYNYMCMNTKKKFFMRQKNSWNGNMELTFSSPFCIVAAVTTNKQCNVYLGLKAAFSPEN